MQYYKILDKHIRDIILFIRRDDGSILDVNAAAESAYGYSRKEMLELTVRDLRANGSEAITAEQMAEADTRGLLFETQHRRKDGSIFPVEVNSQGADIDGQRILVSVIRDITNRKQAEERLREKDIRFRRLMEANIIGVITARMEGVIEANRIFLEMLGYTQQELTEGKVDWQAMTPPEYRRTDEEALREVREKGYCRPTEKEYFRKDGKRIPVLIGAAMITSDPLTLICLVLDMSELKKAQKELERNLSRQTDLLEASMQILAQREIGGLLDVVAASARKLTGARLSSVTYGYIEDQFLTLSFSGAPDISPCPLGSVVKREKGGVYLDLIRKEKSIRLTHEELIHHPAWWGLPRGHLPLRGLLGVRVFGGNSEANGTIMVTDKSEGDFTKEDESVLLQLSALASLGLQNIEIKDGLEQRVQERTDELSKRAEQLARLTSELALTEERERRHLAGIHHDHLQQLLVGVRLNLDTLVGQVPENLKHALKTAHLLIADAVQTSRSITAELSPPILYQNGLIAGIEWLSRWMREKYGFSVQLQIEPGIVVHKEDMTVVLFHSVRELLFNAVKHSGVNSANVSLCKDGPDRLRIVVSDHGSGFDPSRIRQCSKKTGGFGLFAIRERLDLLGGRFDVESAPDKGASFTLIAPVEKAETT